MSAIDKYRELLLRLLPRGRAWATEQGRNLYNLIEGMGVEFSRLEALALTLFVEIDPRTATQLLPEWESFVGLPNECEELQTSLDGRRSAVHRKLTKKGGQSRAYMIALAESFGYTGVTVSEKPHEQARCGVARCGDRLYGPPWLFYWQLLIPDVTINVARCGIARCGDRLQDFQNDALECVINKAKPAHTYVQIIYGS